MLKVSCNLHNQDEFRSLLLSFIWWFPLSKTHWEYRTAIHFYRAMDCSSDLPRQQQHFPYLKQKIVSDEDFKITPKIHFATHVCHCLPQNARLRKRKMKKENFLREIPQCFGVMLSSNFLRPIASASLLDAFWSFTFLHSLDGMESSSESSAMEEAHGDEQGSLSSSARKLFALWEMKRSVVMKWFITTALCSPPFPSFSVLKLHSAWSSVTTYPYFHFLILNKTICTLATQVVPTNLENSDSLILQDSRRNKITLYHASHALWLPAHSETAAMYQTSSATECIHL